MLRKRNWGALLLQRALENFNMVGKVLLTWV